MTSRSLSSPSPPLGQKGKVKGKKEQQPHQHSPSPSCPLPLSSVPIYDFSILPRDFTFPIGERIPFVIRNIPFVSSLRYKWNQKYFSSYRSPPSDDDDDNEDHDNSSSFLVEVEKSLTNRFGGIDSSTTKMLWKDFLQQIQQGKHTMYLNTQYGIGNGRGGEDEKENTKMNQNNNHQKNKNHHDNNKTSKSSSSSSSSSDHRYVVSSPLVHFLQDIPLPLPLPSISSLTIHQMNIWFGSSSPSFPSSSGLHHDYHDNLYCLLRGKKEFTLFPPHQYEFLYPKGKVKKCFSNGLILYAGQSEVNENGILLKEERAGRRRIIEKQMEQIEGKVKVLQENQAGSGKENSKMDKQMSQYLSQMNEFDEEIDKIMDEELNGEREEGEDGEDEDADDDIDDDMMIDDYEESEEDNDDDDDSEENDFRGKWKQKFSIKDGKSENSKKKHFPSKFESNSSSSSSSHPSSAHDLPPLPPPHFSSLNSHYPISKSHGENISSLPIISSSFPLYRHSTPLVVSLLPGDSLFLPASWWHEVKSNNYSENESENNPNEKHKYSHENAPDGMGNSHLALNFWFYPANFNSKGNGKRNDHHNEKNNKEKVKENKDPCHPYGKNQEMMEDLQEQRLKYLHSLSLSLGKATKTENKEQKSQKSKGTKPLRKTRTLREDGSSDDVDGEKSRRQNKKLKLRKIE